MANNTAEEARGLFIAAHVQYSVQDFVNTTRRELGMQIRRENRGAEEKYYWRTPEGEKVAVAVAVAVAPL